MTIILFKEESYKIIGACFEGHKILGHGFKETVYKDALELELTKLNIPVAKEKPYSIFYKEQKLKHYFIADFVVYDSIILEIKTGSYIGAPSLEYQRVILRGTNCFN